MRVGVVATAIIFAMAMQGTRSAAAACERKPGQAVQASGEIDDGWIDKAGNAVYLMEDDNPACATDGFQTYIQDPSGQLKCHAGDRVTVIGSFEAVKYDYTGSGYFIRAKSVRCG